MQEPGPAILNAHIFGLSVDAHTSGLSVGKCVEVNLDVSSYDRDVGMTSHYGVPIEGLPRKNSADLGRLQVKTRRLRT
jgi:hypothetical protein